MRAIALCACGTLQLFAAPYDPWVGWGGVVGVAQFSARAHRRATRTSAQSRRGHSGPASDISALRDVARDTPAYVRYAQ